MNILTTASLELISLILVGVMFGLGLSVLIGRSLIVLCTITIIGLILFIISVSLGSTIGMILYALCTIIWFVSFAIELNDERKEKK